MSETRRKLRPTNDLKRPRESLVHRKVSAGFGGGPRIR